MGGRFWISVIVISVLNFLGGVVVHGVLLRGDYLQLPNLLRPEMEAQGYLRWMILADVLMGFGITWIYVKGRDAARPPVGQGIRFGLAIVVAVTVPAYLIYYAVQPWPGAVVLKQIAYDGIGVVIKGVVIALINQGPRAA